MNPQPIAQSLEADAILTALGKRQYLRPHQSLSDTLDEVRGELGFCDQAAQHGIDWLGMDRQISIGRLRRSELSQLANSIHRFWRRTASRATVQSH